MFLMSDLRQFQDLQVLFGVDGWSDDSELRDDSSRDEIRQRHVKRRIPASDTFRYKRS